MRVACRLLILGATLLLNAHAFAQTKESAASEAIAQAGDAVKNIGSPETQSGPEPNSNGTPPHSTVTVLPDSPSSVAMQDPTTRKKYLESVGRYYEYRGNGFDFRSRVFEWQLLSSRFIFVIVVLLVLAGIYFSAVQFHVALITARRAAEQPAGSPGASPPAAEAVVRAAPPDTKVPSLATQLEISAKGIIVNSSVLGVIVLALSLGFFYLYLVYVYPIRDTL
jgi:hypothetical protein